MLLKSEQQIIENWKLCKSRMVSIFCVTYNHEQFIAETIEGFLSQVTDFPYEIIIGEDCSEDRTLEIIIDYKKKYPNLIKVISGPQNVGPGENFYRTLNASQCEYVAYCDGDDYWHNPNKLQMQFDFIKNRPDYGMVHGRIKILTEADGSIIDYGKSIPEGNVYNVLLKGNFIHSCTVFCRRELLLAAMEHISPKWSMGDYPCWLYIAFHSKIGFINESLATYRVLAASATHLDSLEQANRFFRGSRKIRSYFLSNFGGEYTSGQLLLIYYRDCIRNVCRLNADSRLGLYYYRISKRFRVRYNQEIFMKREIFFYYLCSQYKWIFRVFNFCKSKIGR